jgi:hypothetical protein
MSVATASDSILRSLNAELGELEALIRTFTAIRAADDQGRTRLEGFIS